uniref:Pur-alpha n=1 Tax=Panagrolaimus sp. JU765 TaxID=591449 RepID=A0AC34Q9R7_9BILA
MSPTEKDNKNDDYSKEIAVAKVFIESKRYFVDVKENEKGRFMKITQVTDYDKERVHLVLPMAAAQELAKTLKIMQEKVSAKDYNEHTHSIYRGEFVGGYRQFFADLRQSKAGLYAAVGQVRVDRPLLRIPASGFNTLSNKLQDLVNEHGPGFMEPAEKLPESIKVFGSHNSYYLDCCRSERGFYIKLSEIRGANRNSIGIPADMIDNMIDSLREMKERIPQ